MKKTSIDSRNAAYWERRAAQRMVDYMAEAEKTASDLGQAYYAASESVSADMRRIFGNFQKAFALSEAEAKRIFATVGNERAEKALRKAAEKISDPEQRQLALDALTSAPAYRWRIARLDDLLGDVSEKCGLLYKTELKKTKNFLADLAKTAYHRTTYDLQVGTGTVGAAFDLFPESRITRILKMNWSGRNYSARIYADVKDMESKLKQTLLGSMFTGESEHKIAEKIAERWQIGYNDARRLIRTETTYVANQAELESYRSAGIKEYTFTAVLDSRTSEICNELDGKRFPVDKAKTGVNLPPMHPYCRSTTVAVIEDELFDLSEEELDEELGLNEDVSFEEWLSGLKKGEDGRVRYVGVDKGLTNKAVSDKITSVSKCKNFDEIKQHLSQDYNIELSDDVKSLEFESVRLGLTGFERVAEDFPDIAKNLEKIDAKSGAIASSNGKTLSFGKWYYDDPKKFNEAMESGLARNWYAIKQRRTQADNIAHESGHMIVNAIIEKNSDMSTPLGKYFAAEDWNNGKTSNAILNAAIKEVKKLPEYKKKSKGDILSEYSMYAFSSKTAHQGHEAIAEAVSDYYKNGSKALPLSKVIIKLLKAEF